MSSTASRLPSWFSRAVVEAALIVFAVVLGFIVNEWREDVADRHAAEIAMGRVVAEMESNIGRLEAVASYHEAVVERIQDRLAEIEAEPATGRSVLFDELPLIMPRGINAPGLTSFAWEHAQQHGHLDVLPYETVSETARVYTLQESGVEATWRQIVDLVFSGPQVMREEDITPSLRFTQIGFQELASQERFLIGQYQTVVDELRADGLGSE
ncbi:hypothetical protein [Maricaulis sp.]|uniref:hypothetical protein n=1 Tax=Maricaulis sp. TaxID=1486257 RepID=UPI003A8CDD6B